MSPTKVLNKQSIAEIDQALRKFQEAWEILLKFEECGEECQHYRLMIQTGIDKLTRLKQNFRGG